MNAGKRRTYFFDVRQTKGDDFYLTLTESTRRFDGDGYERHKIFLYKEDFNRFLSNLEEVVDYIKTELMPDYDYEEFDRRHDEWEAQEAEGGADSPPRVSHNQPKTSGEIEENAAPLEKPTPPPPPTEPKMDDDLSW